MSKITVCEFIHDLKDATKSLVGVDVRLTENSDNADKELTSLVSDLLASEKYKKFELYCEHGYIMSKEDSFEYDKKQYGIRLVDFRYQWNDWIIDRTVFYFMGHTIDYTASLEECINSIKLTVLKSQVSDINQYVRKLSHKIETMSELKHSMQNSISKLSK